MSTFWSVFYGVFLASTAFYLVDIIVEAVKETKRKRSVNNFFEYLEDLEDED
jgi:hypothetical protein